MVVDSYPLLRKSERAASTMAPRFSASTYLGDFLFDLLIACADIPTTHFMSYIRSGTIGPLGTAKLTRTALNELHSHSNTPSRFVNRQFSPGSLIKHAGGLLARYLRAGYNAPWHKQAPIDNTAYHDKEHIMRIGVVFPQTEIGADPAGVRDYAQAAESLGYTHLLAYDHVL